jgi:hypothetical protein
VRASVALWIVPFVWLMWDRSEVMALVLGAAWAMQFLDGHRFDRPLRLLTRYGWCPLLTAALVGPWWLFGIGPAIAFAGWAWRNVEPPKLDFAWDGPEQMFASGWSEWWEMTARGLSAMALVAVVIFPSSVTLLHACGAILARILHAN